MNENQNKQDSPSGDPLLSSPSPSLGSTPAGAEGTEETPLIALPSMPSGGGSLRGMGDEWSVNLLTGTGAMSIPVPLTPGRLGFGPSLSLTYDSASGNSPFGLGWSMGAGSISRRTDRGIPRYNDSSDSDTFLSASAGELVPARDELGEPLPSRTVGPWLITRYRPRLEQGFAKIEKWSNVLAPEEVHWQVVDGSNVRRIYGLSATARVTDPANDKRVFRWLLERVFDDRGNITVYEYKPEDELGVDATSVFESNRIGRGDANTYLKRIKYGARETYESDGDQDPSHSDNDLPDEWHFEAVLDYGEHSADPWNAYAETLPWNTRSDPFSSYRAGFEVRTRRRCERVLMFHNHLPTQCDPLKLESEPMVGLQLVSALNLSYEDAPEGSRLTSTWTTGYKFDPNTNAYSSKETPATTLTYTELTVDKKIRTLGGPMRGAIAGANRIADIEGEGIAGMLSEQGGAWYYSRNEGGGEFGAPKALSHRPNGPSISSGGTALMDVAGDGAVCAVQLQSSSPGYFERDTNTGDWLPFRPFKSVPNLPWDSANVRFVDVSGDGLTDVLVSDGNRYCWYQGRGSEGFSNPRAVFKMQDEKEGPSLVFSDPQQTVFLADMSGDGMQDIVRIRNGNIAFWPNLGYAKFGPKVQMARAPRFDRLGRFDASRVRISDVDGSGTADIIYLGDRGATLYLNQSGNSWSEGHVLPFPPMTSTAHVQVADLLGTGTGCLLWSSSSPGVTGSKVRYLDLASSTKPYLLTEVNNGRGMVRKVTYASSTQYYLADRKAGRPWACKLPFPVQVIASTETRDLIAGGSLVSSYSYHHGYYDRDEREFRGFGLVEQSDTEYFLPTSELDGSPDWSLDEELRDTFAPPIVSRTWHHLGSARDGKRISDAFEAEYWTPTADSPYLEPITDDLSDGGRRDRIEAMRALKGRVIRSEVYGKDGSEAEGKPYAVTRAAYSVRAVQHASADAAGVYFVAPKESISYAYERDASDPRVTHSMTLEVDAFGNVERSASIAYPRDSKRGTMDPLYIPQTELKATVTEAEFFNSAAPTSPTGTYYEYAEDPSAWYRLGVPLRSSVWEYSVRSDATLLDLDTVRTNTAPGTVVTGHAERIAARAEFDTALDAPPQLRKLGESFSLYMADACPSGGYAAAIPLAPGIVQSKVLPFESYTLAITPDVLDAVFGLAELPDGVDPTGREWVRRGFSHDLSDEKIAELGYWKDEDDNWWIPSGRAVPGDPDDFYRPEASIDRFGNRADVVYDDDSLTIVGSLSPTLTDEEPLVRLSTRTFTDYRLMAPTLSCDANDNYSSVEVDALGQVVATATMGKVDSTQDNGYEGDTLDQPTTRFAYQLRYRDAEASIAPTIPCVQTEAKTEFGTDWETADRIVSVAYSDGFGRALVARAQAGSLHTRLEVNALAGAAVVKLNRTAGISPGMRIVIDDTHKTVITAVEGDRDVTLQDPLPNELLAQNEVPIVVERWIATGRTTYDAKERPVRQYEPYFTGGEMVQLFEGPFSEVPAFELDDVLDGRGVASLLSYDPMGRVVRTDAPDGTFSKVEFTPWEQASFDANDTVLESQWRVDALAKGGAAAEAAVAAEAHANTPTLSLIDALGRPYAVGSRSNAADPNLYEISVHDIAGNVLALYDRRGNRAFEYRYDLLGRQLFADGQDNGLRWGLPDASSSPALSWKGAELSGDHWYSTRVEYDALRRPTRTWQTHDWDGSGTPEERCIGFVVYGFESPDPAGLNLLRQAFQTHDSAGQIESLGFNFAGHPLGSMRRLARFEESIVLDSNVLYELDPDWSEVFEPPAGLTPQEVIDSLLEEAEFGLPEVFESSATLDALGRPLVETKAHIVGDSATSVSYGYDEGGAMVSMTATDIEGGVRQVIEHIEHNARGQRVQVKLGCGVTTTSSYNPNSFRMTVQKSVGADGNLQELKFIYDAVGTITQIEDAAQETIFFDGDTIEPIQTFTYDSLYRLIQATGREHAPIYGLDPTIRPGGLTGGSAGVVAQGELRNYQRSYDYDDAGNMRALDVHDAWTRSMEIDPLSNRIASVSLSSSDPGDSFALSYDQYGQMLVLPNIADMRWDAAGNIRYSKASSASTERTWYVYGADNQRVRKVTEVPAGDGWRKQRETLYVGGHEVHRTFNTTGLLSTRQTSHLMDGDHRVATLESLDDGRVKGRYSLSNQVRSVSVELADVGEVISMEEFHPYGTTSWYSVDVSKGYAAKQYRYSGKERDTETGLDYYGYRYLCSWLGRWASPDPAGAVDGLNIYEFVHGAPNNSFDLLGLEDVGLPVGNLSARDPEPEPGRLLERVRENRSDEQGSQTFLVVAAGGVSENYEERTPTQGRLIDAVVEQVDDASLSVVYLAPGLTSRSAEERGMNAIMDDWEPGDAVVMYGFSHGGVVVTRLAGRLQDEGVEVQLLVTVDAAYSRRSHREGSVPRTIPDNVVRNVNFYQVSSMIRPSNVLGSRGYPNVAEGEDTVIDNRLIGRSWEGYFGVEPTSHQAIDEDVFDDSVEEIVDVLQPRNVWPETGEALRMN